MPKYNYKCNSCDYRFEIEQKMSDDVLKQCPECTEQSLQKVIGSNVGIAFKGSGFYTNSCGANSEVSGADCAQKQAGSCCCQ